MTIASTIRAMRAAGVPDQQIIDTVLVMEEERLANGRARTAKHRNNKDNGDVTYVTDVTNVTKESSPCTPSKKTTPLKSPKGDYSPRKRDVDHAFESFWAVYPKRVEKQGAYRRFEQASRKIDPERIVAGAKAYALHLRETESLDFCKHPTTWLNNGCWDDEYGVGNNSPGAWSEAAWRGACKAWKRGEGWPDNAGDPPDMPTTNVPPEILQELEI